MGGFLMSTKGMSNRKKQMESTHIMRPKTNYFTNLDQTQSSINPETTRNTRESNGDFKNDLTQDSKINPEATQTSIIEDKEDPIPLEVESFLNRT
jgi:hypothetical protein